MMLNRRNFLLKAGLLTGATVTGCLNKEKDQNQQEVIAGEEWKNDQRIGHLGKEEIATHREIVQNARQNIEKYRKSEVTIALAPRQKDQQIVEIECFQTGHAFDFGCSFGGNLNQPKSFFEQANPHFNNLFNSVTAKCYWDERWHQPIEHEEGKRVLSTFKGERDWGLVNGMRVKGHPLVWTVRKAIPKWIDQYSYPEQLKQMEKHVRNLIREGGPEIKKWDLCNEMLWEPSLRNLPKRNWPHIETYDEILSYLEPAVNWANEENPNAIYALNDYGLVKTYNDKISSAEQRTRYVELIETMKKRGCQPDAMGTQCHVAGWYTGEEFKTHLDHLAQAGLPIQITEFWAKKKDNPLKDEQNNKAQIQYVTDMYTIGFGHPSVNHFTYWGRDMFKDDGQPNALYHAMHQLIKQDWHTHHKTTRPRTGSTIKFKAFHGDYVAYLHDQQGNLYKKHFTVMPESENVFLF